MSRFKTELCNNLIELGNCKYGDRCHYAHGVHELRQVSRRHPKYRTEKCKNFELTGRCPFGPRCSYVHPKPDLDSMIEQLTRYVQHTKAPKPDSEDDDDETNVSSLFSRTATSSSLLSQTESASSSNANLRQNMSDDANKENQLVADYTVGAPYYRFSESKQQSNESKLNYIDNPFALESKQSAILKSHKPLATIAHNQQEQQHSRRLPSSLAIQRPQQAQRIAMRALSSNSQQSHPQDRPGTYKDFGKCSSPISTSSSPSLNSTITASNPFGISNPLSDYFNTTSSNKAEGGSLFPNKQFITRF